MRIPFNWGTAIAAAYTIFAVGTTAFVTFAMGRPVDLVSDDYYAQSLRQDERIAAERNTLALRPQPQVLQEPGRLVTLALPPGHAETGQGTLTLFRPSDSGQDRRLPLALDREGRQRFSLDGLAPGRWVLQVRWSAAGTDYYFEHAVYAQ